MQCGGELCSRIGISGCRCLVDRHHRAAGLPLTTSGVRGQFQAAFIPGGEVDFRKAQQAEAPTKGRSLDHIGFEVKNLEAFCKKLEADGIKLTGPYRKVPALGIAVAFMTDPWGTYIEMTEGLDKVP